MSAEVERATITNAPLRCEQCGGIVGLVTALADPHIASLILRPLCAACAVRSGAATIGDVERLDRWVAWAERIVWAERPDAMTAATLVPIGWRCIDIPGGDRFTDLHVEALGITIRHDRADLDALPLKAIRAGSATIALVLVQFRSDRHGVVLRRWASLPTAQVRSDLLNVEGARADDLAEMLRAQAMLDVFVERRGRPAGDGVPMDRASVVEAIRTVTDLGQLATQARVMVQLWPEGGGITSDRGFRDRLAEPDMFPGKSWPQIRAEALTR